MNVRRPLVLTETGETLRRARHGRRRRRQRPGGRVRLGIARALVQLRRRAAQGSEEGRAPHSDSRVKERKKYGWLARASASSSASAKDGRKLVRYRNKDLLEAGVHFGHQTKRWNPKMKPFIFGERNGIYIIDLTKTADKFRDAEDFVTNLAADGRTILFVGTKRRRRT
jgi:hypothetical protein